MATFFFSDQHTIPSTRKLFHQNPALYESEAEVVHVAGDLVVLDRTIFYAESGGQVSDRGTISGVAVESVGKAGGKPVRIARRDLEDIHINTGTFIVHKLAEPAPFAVGDRVSLAIDADFRRAVTRNHSAAHFLFVGIGAVLAARGERIDTRGCLIDGDGFRFDIANAIAPEQIAAIADHANQLIAEGATIGMEPDSACDDVFYWRYGDIVIPCGGTHLKSAAELGPMTVSRRSKGRGALRISGLLAAD
jgi:alanyl-tRNA synthetase